MNVRARDDASCGNSYFVVELIIRQTRLILRHVLASDAINDQLNDDADVATYKDETNSISSTNYYLSPMLLCNLITHSSHEATPELKVSIADP